MEELNKYKMEKISEESAPSLTFSTNNCSPDLALHACMLCRLSFSSKLDYETHTASCTKELNKYERKSVYPRKCTKCFKILKTSNTFSKHKKSCGKNKTVYPRTCEICKNRYMSPSSFCHHKKNCCKYSSARACTLNSNADVCRQRLEAPYTCTYCGVSFPGNNTLNNHISSCIGFLPQTYFSCIFSECSRSFSCVRLLSRHLSEDHGSNYVTDLTFESFASFQEFIKSEGMATFKFKKVTGSKRKISGTLYHYYRCHFYKPHYGKPLGFRRNRKGTIPFTHCPVSIYATEKEGIIKAFYFSQHNHEIPFVKLESASSLTLNTSDYSEDLNLLTCIHCGISFCSKFDYQSHIASCIEELCKYKKKNIPAESAPSLTLNTNDCGRDLTLLSCVHCKLSFSSKHDHATHLESCMEESDSPTLLTLNRNDCRQVLTEQACETCGLSFSTKHDRETHVVSCTEELNTRKNSISVESGTLLTLNNNECRQGLTEHACGPCRLSFSSKLDHETHVASCTEKSNTHKNSISVKSTSSLTLSTNDCNQNPCNIECETHVTSCTEESNKLKKNVSLERAPLQALNVKDCRQDVISQSCVHCGLSFSSKQNYKNHIASCTEELNKHKKSISIENSLPLALDTTVCMQDLTLHACVHCGVRFSCKYEYESHILSCIEKLNKYNKKHISGGSPTTLTFDTMDCRKDLTLYACSHCGLSFSDICDLENHIPLCCVESNKHKTKCKSVESVPSQNLSASDCSTQDLFACAQCGVSFLSSRLDYETHISSCIKELNKHISVKNATSLTLDSTDCTQDLTLYTCEHCGLNFSSKCDCETHVTSCIEELNKHKKIMSVENSSSLTLDTTDCIQDLSLHTCVHCGIGFSSKFDYKTHISDTHGTGISVIGATSLTFNTNDCSQVLTEYACEHCGVSSPSKLDHETHVASCTEESSSHKNSISVHSAISLTVNTNVCSQDLTFQGCIRCGLNFSTELDYETHIASCTKELNKYERKSVYPRKCTKCFKILKTSNSFSKHKKSCGKYKVVYPRTCEICHKCYISPSSFCHHRKKCRESSSSRVCTLYSNAYVSEQRLEAPYTCTYCGVSFPENNSFVNHVSSCIGYLPKTYFSCTFAECSRSFSCVRLLSRHLSADHGGNYVRNLTFESPASFQQFIKSEGMATFKFKKMTGSKNSSGTLYHYYRCHFYKPHYGKPLGFRRNRKGTIPFTHCPVSIFATEKEGIIKAFYFYQHNHEINVDNC